MISNDSNSCFEVSLWEVQSGSRRELQKLQVLELFFAESRCAFTEHVHVLGFSLNLGHQERENAKLKLVEFVVQSSSHILANLWKPHCFAHWCSLSLPFNRFIGSNSTEGAGTPFEWCPSQRHHNCYRKSSWTITATGSPGYQWVLWVASCMWIPCHSFDSLVEHHLHHQGRWDSSNEWLAVCNLPAVQLRFGICSSYCSGWFGNWLKTLTCFQLCNLRFVFPRSTRKKGISRIYVFFVCSLPRFWPFYTILSSCGIPWNNHNFLGVKSIGFHNQKRVDWIFAS